MYTKNIQHIIVYMYQTMLKILANFILCIFRFWVKGINKFDVCKY